MEDGDKMEKSLFLIRGLAAGASKGHIASQSLRDYALHLKIATV